ncbi:MAG: hypothetical protein V1835_04760 [Candidatus Micrarchaeota archaeon]
MVVLRNGVPGIPHITAANGRKDARGWIISILSKEWPLAAKEIYYRIRNSNGKDISYQGIHKAIRQLASEGVLMRAQSKYSISMEWMEGLRKFGDELCSSLKGRRCLHLDEISEKTSVPLVFDSFIDYFYWLIEELFADSKRIGANESTYAITHHPWPITNISKQQYQNLREFLTAGEHYLTCKGGSHMDRAMVELWKNAGSKAKLRADCAKNCDMLAYKDYVLQLFIPNKTRSELGRVFNNGSKINGETISKLYLALYETAEPVNVIITRNPELAAQIKEEVLQEFH